jgi:membrane protein DedA with SNARE-associated domain
VLDNLITFFTDYGYFAVFSVLLLCGFGLPIPEDISLVAGGFISSLTCTSSGPFFKALEECDQIHTMFFVCMAGVLLGDIVMFSIGYVFGEKVFKLKIFSKIETHERYEWITSKFEKHGLLFIFAARFMPGLRSPIFLTAGMTKRVSYLKFILTDGFAALISVPIWVYLGFWGERQLSDMKLLEQYVKRGQLSLVVILAICIATFAVIWFVKKKIKEKTHFLE